MVIDLTGFAALRLFPVGILEGQVFQKTSVHSSETENCLPIKD
jgi:hypothetical protein